MSVARIVQNAYLSNLQGGLRDRLLPLLRRIELRSKAVVQRMGAPITHVLFPCSGAISLATSAGGASIQCAVVGREGILGGWIASESVRSPYHATVRIEGFALELPMAEFCRVIANNEELRSQVARENYLQIAAMSQIVACHAKHTTEQRMCRSFLEYEDRNSDRPIIIKQEELADMLGVQRTTVTLLVGRLQAVGAVQWRRGRLRILHRHVVESRACACCRSRSLLTAGLPHQNAAGLPSNSFAATVPPDFSVTAPPAIQHGF